MKRMWPFVFLAGGIAIVIYGVGLVLDARNCASWPWVEGRVLRAEAQVVAREKDKRTYAPNVTYNYSVNGTSYEKSRLTLVPKNYSAQFAVDAVLAQYPVGSTVKVYHDPKDPANCVLVTTPTGTEWAYPLGGVLMIGAGLYMWLRE